MPHPPAHGRLAVGLETGDPVPAAELRGVVGRGPGRGGRGRASRPRGGMQRGSLPQWQGRCGRPEHPGALTAWPEPAGSRVPPPLIPRRQMRLAELEQACMGPTQAGGLTGPPGARCGHFRTTSEKAKHVRATNPSGQLAECRAGAGQGCGVPPGPGPAPPWAQMPWASLSQLREPLPAQPRRRKNFLFLLASLLKNATFQQGGGRRPKHPGQASWYTMAGRTRSVSGAGTLWWVIVEEPGVESRGTGQ